MTSLTGFLRGVGSAESSPRRGLATTSSLVTAADGGGTGLREATTRNNNLAVTVQHDKCPRPFLASMPGDI